MSKRDPQGYYKILGLSPTATQGEIRLAYRFLKDAYKNGRKSMKIGEIRAAYSVLKEPATRQEYDGRNEPPPGSQSRGQSFLGSPGLLLVVVLILAAVGAWALAPAIRAGLVGFDVGDDLFWAKTSKPLGVVVEVEQEHSFADGVYAGYRIQGNAGEAIWLPARDLNSSCRRR